MKVPAGGASLEMGLDFRVPRPFTFFEAVKKTRRHGCQGSVRDFLVRLDRRFAESGGQAVGLLTSFNLQQETLATCLDESTVASCR